MSGQKLGIFCHLQDNVRERRNLSRLPLVHAQFFVNIINMTITVDTNQFIYDSLDRICKQTHLSDNYTVGLFSPSEIPASVKKICKGIIPADFFNGAKSKIVVLKSKESAELSDDDQMKITKFIKTTFFLTDDSPFSSNDVYQVKEFNGEKSKNIDDNEEDSESDVKRVYYFIKLELK